MIFVTHYSLSLAVVGNLVYITLKPGEGSTHNRLPFFPLIFQSRLKVSSSGKNQNHVDAGF